MKGALQTIDVNRCEVNEATETPETLKTRRVVCADVGPGSPGVLTPIPEEPTPKSSVKRGQSPLDTFLELSKAGDVSPQSLEEELCKVIEGEGTDATTVTSPMLNEWLSGLGLRERVNTPARLELKALKRASHENVHLRKLLEKVKEVELEIAAEEAKSAAELWDCLEQECGELQEQNQGLRKDIEAAQSKVAQNDEESKELRKKMEGIYASLQETEEECAVLKDHLEGLNKILLKGESGEVNLATQAEIKETAKEINSRVEAMVTERGRLENDLKVALQANKKQHEEQSAIKGKYDSLRTEMQECKSALEHQKEVTESVRKLLKEKDAACQKVFEEQRRLKMKCEISEREKQEACEKALEACEEILLEQAAMKEKYEILEKEKAEGCEKVLKLYEKTIQDVNELKERCEKLEIEKQEASDAALRGQAHLRGKEEAFKIALEDSSLRTQELEILLEEKEKSLDAAMAEGKQMISESVSWKAKVQQEQGKCKELESLLEEKEKSLDAAVAEQVKSESESWKAKVQQEQGKCKELESLLEEKEKSLDAAVAEQVKSESESWKAKVQQEQEKCKELESLLEEKEKSLDAAVAEQVKSESESWKAKVQQEQGKCKELESLLEEKEKSLDAAMAEGKQMISVAESWKAKVQQEQEKCKELESLLEEQKEVGGAEKEEHCKITSKQVESTLAWKEDEGGNARGGGIGLALFPRNSPSSGHVEVKLNLDLSPSSRKGTPNGKEGSVTPRDDVYDAALLHIRFKKLKQRNKGRRFMPNGYDVSADECRRRANALGLRSSPIFRSKRYSRTS